MSSRELYKASRDGDLNNVKQLLPLLNLEQINGKEPDHGSTSLHAACYFNHPQIVQVLLDYGASRTIKNNYGCTPFDETQTEQVKELFGRPWADAQKRFVADILIDQTIEYSSTKNAEYGWYYRQHILDADLSEAIAGITGDERFEIEVDTNAVKNLLEEAERTQDPGLLVQIYSSGTDFYYVVNKTLAQDESLQIRSNEKADLYSFVGIFLRHDALKKYRYVGPCYRGMKLSKEEFEKNYNIGQTLLIKPFISTSKRREKAEKFASKSPIASKPLSILCIITIPERTLSYEDHVALDIVSMSDYPDEDEVLILPYTSWRIGSIRHLASGLIEIEMNWYSFLRDGCNNKVSCAFC